MQSGLCFFFLVFDWRLGLLCLIPVVIAFAVMSCMMGDNMKKKMAEYQNALVGNAERGGMSMREEFLFVKTFGQSVFRSREDSRIPSRNMRKWTVSLHKGFKNPDDGLYCSH
ncbi:MAG: hypothetical protein ACLR7D_10175 [Lachnospira eligens]